MSKVSSGKQNPKNATWKLGPNSAMVKGELLLFKLSSP